jgi:hypothetical protein
VKTEAELRARYYDIVEDGADTGTVRLIETLDTAYQSGMPPASFVAETRALLRQRHAGPSRGRTVLGLALPSRARPFAGLAAVLLAAVLVTATVAYAANSILHIYHPEQPGPPPLSRLFWVPSLPPYPTVRYRTLDPARAAHESGYAVAYLHKPPLDLSTSVGVDIFPHVGWPPMVQPRLTAPRFQGLAVAIRSVVRYRGGGHTVIVLLNEPSPKAIRTRLLVLGERTIHLSNGEDAWASTDVSGSLPFIRPRFGAVQVLAWAHKQYVVSLFSDLPSARLRDMATDIAVIPPNADPRRRHFPRTWPAPLAPDRLPGRLRAVISGAATYEQRGPKLTIRYLVNFGSYSQGALYGLDKWQDVQLRIGFPPALQRHALTRAPEARFGSGAGGTGGNISFNVRRLEQQEIARLLRSGMQVRLTWSEQGKRRGQSFVVPVIAAKDCAAWDPGCQSTIPR